MQFIEFRAWHRETAQMLPQETNDIRFIHPLTQEFITPYSKDIETMQFSGLYDKNHKKIYSGDWIETDRGSVLEIHFKDGCFLAKGKDSIHGRLIDDWLNVFASWSEVIGNIHENPRFEQQKSTV